MENPENDLRQLLENLQPSIQPGPYVFCTVRNPSSQLMNEAVGIFHELEGSTLILPKVMADMASLKYNFEAAWITLEVHSSLKAVGLTAAFSTALTKAGISCNVMAGYYHDHIFVPINKSEEAMSVLKGLKKA